MQTTELKDQNMKKNSLRLVALLFVVGLTILLVIFKNQIGQLAGLGYPGIFLASLLASSSLILPMPGVLLTAAMGAVLSPFWVAIAAGSGAALGEITGYLAGTSGQAVVENTSVYQKVIGWMKHYGDLTILVLAFIPNPLFDIAGIAAGTLKMPVYRFLFWCFLGKILKMLVFAYLGYAAETLWT